MHVRTVAVLNGHIPPRPTKRDGDSWREKFMASKSDLLSYLDKHVSSHPQR